VCPSLLPTISFISDTSRLLSLGYFEFSKGCYNPSNIRANGG
jgi:hypothetical protein